MLIHIQCGQLGPDNHPKFYCPANLQNILGEALPEGVFIGSPPEFHTQQLLPAQFTATTQMGIFRGVILPYFAEAFPSPPIKANRFFLSDSPPITSPTDSEWRTSVPVKDLIFKEPSSTHWAHVTGDLVIHKGELYADSDSKIRVNSNSWNIVGNCQYSTSKPYSSAPFLLLKGNAVCRKLQQTFSPFSALRGHYLGNWYEVDVTPISQTVADDELAIASKMLQNRHSQLSHKLENLVRGTVDFHDMQAGVHVHMEGVFKCMEYEQGYHYVLVKGTMQRTTFGESHPSEIAEGVFDIYSVGDYTPLLLEGTLSSGNRRINVSLSRLQIENLRGELRQDPRIIMGKREVYSASQGGRLLYVERCTEMGTFFKQPSETNSVQFSQPELFRGGKYYADPETDGRSAINRDKGLFFFSPKAQVIRYDQHDTPIYTTRAESIINDGEMRFSDERTLKISCNDYDIYAADGDTRIQLHDAPIWDDAPYSMELVGSAAETPKLTWIGSSSAYRGLYLEAPTTPLTEEAMGSVAKVKRRATTRVTEL
ncbi:MAG: hypothetical protein O3A01_02830 [bacterium]|nr:hypothetical protein [bacterium]